MYYYLPGGRGNKLKTKAAYDLATVNPDTTFYTSLAEQKKSYAEATFRVEEDEGRSTAFRAGALSYNVADDRRQ